MAPEVWKEASAPPKAEARAKALKAKKAMPHTHTKIQAHSHFSSPKYYASSGSLPVLRRAPPGEAGLTTAIMMATEFAMKFIVDLKTMEQAVKKLYGIDVASVSTLIRPDGGKAYVGWLLMMMLWMLPTKLGSSKLNLAG